MGVAGSNFCAPVADSAAEGLCSSRPRYEKSELHQFFQPDLHSPANAVTTSINNDIVGHLAAIGRAGLLDMRDLREI